MIIAETSKSSKDKNERRKEMNQRRTLNVFMWVLLFGAFLVTPVMSAEPIKIGIIQGLSGPYEIYAKAEVTGFKMGLEYFTKGTNNLKVKRK
jgi:branched-chain amino acid transport system substrate-binding protein